MEVHGDLEGAGCLEFHEAFKQPVSGEGNRTSWSESCGAGSRAAAMAAFAREEQSVTP